MVNDSSLFFRSTLTFIGEQSLYSATLIKLKNQFNNLLEWKLSVQL